MQPLKNPRHEAFARGVAAGASQADAYRDAGYKPTPAARANAARLIATDSVRARVEALKREAAERAIVTAEDVLRGLKREAETAESDTARVAAWAHLGKHLGMFTERHDITYRKDPAVMTDDELDAALRAAGLN